jgi:signal transduction histidine kinase/DNA-binding response OmpR family regulator
MNQDARAGSFLRRFPIKARLVALAVVLLLATVGSSLYIRSALHQAQLLSENAGSVAENIATVAAIRSAFNDLRYWQADLAVSQLVLAENNAAEARGRLADGLKKLAATQKTEAHDIEALAAQFNDLAKQAVDAYTDDQRVVGNAHFAQARQIGLEIDRKLKDLQSALAARAQAARGKILEQFDRASMFALSLTALAVLIGAFLTYVILRSILKPLGEIVLAVRGLIAGDTRIAIPPATGDELGRVSEGLVLLRQSLTERERLMQEAESQRKRLFDAIESIAEGFVLYDPQGRLAITNQPFRDIHPMHVGLAAAKASFREVVTAAAHYIVETNVPAEEWVAKRLASHGHQSVRIAALRDGRWMQISERETHDGGFTVVYTDISELRRRQEELEAARDEAQRATQVKSDFLANMSHELRTPLNAIIGYSQILQEDMQDAGQTGFLPDLNKIETAGNHLLGLINDILDLSKIEAGRMEIYNENFDVAGLVEDVRMLVRPLATKNDNTLVVNCPHDTGSVESDVTKVKQILLNLLSNASKFTRNGTIELLVERRHEHGGILAFSVKDSGIGMSEEQLERLFQAFSQADSSTSRKFGGTGLGLAISRSFAQMLGGDLTVSSEPGKGSCFLFTLPDGIAEGDDAGPSATGGVRDSISADAGDSRQSVLVVDDDEVARHIIGSHLTRDGFGVLYAKSGVEALDMARRHRPAAITLDIMMPKMDGWSVLVALKKEPELAGIPVIIVSISDDKTLGFTLGASDMLTKPVDRARLGESVAQLTRAERSATILIVEDDETTRGMMSRTVERIGHVAALTQNGREAMDWLAANPKPSAILLDLNMPEMNGFDFLTRLRDNDDWSGIPVLVVTAQQLSPEERQSLDDGSARVIAKGRSAHLELSHALRATLGMREPAAAAKA